MATREVFYPADCIHPRGWKNGPSLYLATEVHIKSIEYQRSSRDAAMCRKSSSQVMLLAKEECRRPCSTWDV